MAKVQEKTVEQKRISVLLTSMIVMKLAAKATAATPAGLAKLLQSFDDLIDDTVHLCMCAVCTDSAYESIDGDLLQTIDAMYTVAKATQQDKHGHGDPSMN